MSQTSFSFSPNKRPRTFSQLSNRSNASTNFMKTAPTVITKVGPKREVGGSGVQRGGTAGTKNKKKLKIPYGWLERLIFPPSYVKLLNYGLDMYNKNTYTYTSTSSGDCKMLRGLPGRQVWAEFEALPLYNPSVYEVASGTIIRGVNINCRYSVEQLISEAAANKWVDSVFDNTLGIPIETAFGSPSAPTLNDSATVIHSSDANPQPNAKLNKAFIYNGGHQRHTFINHSNTSTWIEVVEACPRNPTFDWVDCTAGSPATDTHLRWIGVGDYVLTDYKDNAVAGKSGDVIAYTAVDEITDVSVKINSKLQRTLAMYKMSKPMTICLAPGEQFVYTMDLPPFMFDNLGFAEHMAAPFGHVNGGFDRISTTKYRPTSIPRFTKRLVVRAWSEIGHSDVSAANDTAFTGTLQPVQVNLFHLQEEEHNVRFAPVMNKNYSNIQYHRDLNTTYTLQVFDDANETIEAVDI